MKNRTEFFKKKLKVLHVAPEQCLKKIFKKSRNLDYTTLDLYDRDVDLQMDVTNIKLPDNLFDCIICYHVLEHIPDDAKAISELCRVLKPGGFAIIQVPIDENADQTYENSSIVGPKEREVAFGQYDHVRRYGRDYKNRLEKAGFSVKRDDYVRHLGEKRIAKYGLAGGEYIYVCSKSKV